MKLTVVSWWAQKLFRLDEPQPFGGAELQLVTLSKALVKHHDVEVTFITRGQGAEEHFTSGGIHVHKLPYRSNRLTRSLMGMRDCLSACAESQPDVLIQRGGGIETGLTARAALSLNTPFVFMTSSQWDLDGTHDSGRGIIYGRFYRYGLKRASSIIIQTDEQQKMLATRYGREGTVLRSAQSIPESIPQNKKGILWVGRHDLCKVPDLFVDLAEAIPEQRFTMICPKANLHDEYEALKQRARRLPNLTFSEGVPFEETERLFASHRLMVCTSNQEGYPNTFIQAMKWGVPIITAEFDPDSIIESNALGIRAGTMVDDLKRAVNTLLNHSQTWNTYSQNARKFALHHHDVNQAVDQLHALLFTTITKHHQASHRNHQP